MSKKLFRPFPVITIGLVLCTVCGVLLAQTLQKTDAGPVTQVFALTTSAQETYDSTTSALLPIPETSLTFTVNAQSLLTISFSAQGDVAPQGTATPEVQIECQIDGQPCQPDTNTVTFLYPAFCCDTRSFQWVAHNVPAGSHTVRMLWLMGGTNPLGQVTNRSLVVEAATK